MLLDMEMCDQLHAQVALSLGKSPSTHGIGGWVGPRTALDNVETIKFLTLPGLELRLLGRPSSSQTLYPLRYSGYNF
jgi:hypothetical protein